MAVFLQATTKSFIRLTRVLLEKYSNASTSIKTMGKSMLSRWNL